MILFNRGRTAELLATLANHFFFPFFLFVPEAADAPESPLLLDWRVLSLGISSPTLTNRSLPVHTRGT